MTLCGECRILVILFDARKFIKSEKRKTKLAIKKGSKYAVYEIKIYFLMSFMQRATL